MTTFGIIAMAIAVVTGAALPFNGPRGLLTNIALALLFVAGLIVAGSALGLVLHSAIFEPYAIP